MVMSSFLLVLSIVVTTSTAPASAFAPSSTKIQRAASVLVERATAHSPAFARYQHQHHQQFLSKKFSTSSVVLDATVVESESTVTNSSAINDGDIDDGSQTIVTKTQAVNGDFQSTVVSLTDVPPKKAGTLELLDREAQLLQDMEAQATAIVDDMMEESCEVDEATGGPKDELCVDEVKRKGFRATVKGYVKSIESLVVGRKGDDVDVAPPGTPRKQLTGDELEKGCECCCS